MEMNYFENQISQRLTANKTEYTIWKWNEMMEMRKMDAAFHFHLI